MMSDVSPEPDQPGRIIYVGQDCAGHWLVQDSGKTLEGRFVSYAAAMHYAREEREIYRAEIAIASAPLVPLVSFDPAPAPRHALARAA
nr:hypothetical protein [uncultured Sphingomonas sp.]